MAGLMTAPMMVIELILIGSMYENKKWNTLIIIASLFALVLFWALVRQQTGISDKEFLGSMIPHHAGAILMCEQAPIQELQIKELCQSIISNQQTEIQQMKMILTNLKE